MGKKFIERVIGKATYKYIGTIFKPYAMAITNTQSTYQIKEVVSNVLYEIRGTLDLVKLTGTLEYYGSTFYFKFNKYGTVVDIGKKN